MYGLLLLIGGVLLILWIALPFMVFSLIRRVRELEDAVYAGRNNAVAPAVELPDMPESQMAQPAQQVVSAREPGWEEKFGAWIKEDWLLKLGALLLLIALGWFVRYAFVQGWIGPAGRITLGITLGALFLAFGAWRIRAYVHQGGVFLVVGSTTILLTVFAARNVYDFFTPATALGIMFFSSAFVALASIKHNTRALSVASVVLAGIAPLLAGGSGEDILLFSYLLVVVLGAVWIVGVTGHREVTAVSLLVVSFFSVPHLLNRTAESSTLLYFAYAFAAVFFVTNMVGVIRLKAEEDAADLFTAAFNGIFLLFWIMTAAPEEWRSLIIAAWMIAFVAGAFAVFRLTGKRGPFYIDAGIGVAMLGTATAAELSGPALTIAFAIESAMLCVAGYLVLRDIRVAESLILLFILPIAFSIESMDPHVWREGVIHSHFFVLLVLAASLLGVAAFFAAVRAQTSAKDDTLSLLPLVAGSVYAYVLLWRSLHAGIDDRDLAVGIALVTYTIIGLVAYFYGTTRSRKGFLVYGGMLLAFVVGRLLLVDVWRMEIAGRIVTFFLIGALLMSTAFFSRSRKNAS